MKCLSKDRNSNGCRNHSIDNSRFCKLHQYMNEYTDSMLEQLRLCSGCSKMHYMTDTKYVTCEGCRTREKPKSNVVLCKSNNCKFKKSDENDYCGKHQLCVFVDETTANGEKVCVNYLRGCRTQLDMSYKYTRCVRCLEKDREKDRQRRGKAIEPSTDEPSTRICSMCNKSQDISQYNGQKGNITRHCNSCREKGKIRDKNRNKDIRNEKAQIAESNPERKRKKKKWSENIRYKSESYHYNSYKTHAHERGLCFDLEIDIYMSIIYKKCYYCNSMNNAGFNGVDRKDNIVGYTLDNSVACCSTCNFMKKTTESTIFIKKAIHIDTYNREKVRLYPEIFSDHKYIHYCTYNRRSLERYNIEINKQYYDNIVIQPCYLCGKENTETHKNGIDRFDNDIGYTQDNCRPCCGDCNMMKRNYPYDLVIEQCKKISVKNKSL